MLTVNAIHQDVPVTAAMTAEIDEEIAGLAAWLGLELTPPGRDAFRV